MTRFLVILACALASVAAPRSARAGDRPLEAQVRDDVVLLCDRSLKGKVKAAALTVIADDVQAAYAYFRDVLKVRPPKPAKPGGKIYVRVHEFSDDMKYAWAYALPDGIHVGVPAANDWGPAGGAHELFHLVQASYEGTDSAFLQESTAEWAAESFAPKSKTFPHERSFLLDPQLSLHLETRKGTGELITGQGRPYGASIFVRYATTHHPRGIEVVRDWLENCDIGSITESDASENALRSLRDALRESPSTNPTEEDPLRGWFERFAEACVLGVDGKGDRRIPRMETIAQGGPARAFVVDSWLDNHYRAPRRRPDVSLRVPAVDLHGLGMRFYTAVTPPNLPKDVPLYASVPSATDELSVFALVPRGEGWAKRRAVYDAAAKRYDLTVPDFGGIPRETYVVVLRYSHVTTGEMVALDLATGDPPVLEEITLTQRRKELLHLRYEAKRDPDGMLLSRERKEVLPAGAVDPSAGDVSVQLVFSRPVKRLGDLPVCRLGKADAKILSIDGKSWDGHVPAAALPKAGEPADVFLNGFTKQEGNQMVLELDEDPTTAAAVRGGDWTSYEVTQAGMRIPLRTAGEKTAAPPVIRRAMPVNVLLNGIEIETGALSELGSRKNAVLEFTWTVEEEGRPTPLLRTKTQVASPPPIGKSIEEDPRIDNWAIAGGRRVAEDRIVLFADAFEPLLPSRPDAPLNFVVRQTWMGRNNEPVEPPLSSGPLPWAKPVVRIEPLSNGMLSFREWREFKAALAQPDIGYRYPQAEVTVTSGRWTGRFFASGAAIRHERLYKVPEHKRDREMNRISGPGWAKISVPLDPRGSTAHVTIVSGERRAESDLPVPGDERLSKEEQAWLANEGSADKNPLTSSTQAQRALWLEAAKADRPRHEKSITDEEQAIQRFSSGPAESAAHRAARTAGALRGIAYARYELLRSDGWLAFEYRVAAEDEIDSWEFHVAKTRRDWPAALRIAQRRAKRTDPEGARATEEASWKTKKLAIDREAAARMTGKDREAEQERIGQDERVLADLSRNYAMRCVGWHKTAFDVAPLAGDGEALIAADAALRALRAKFQRPSDNESAWLVQRRQDVADLWVMLGGDPRAAADLWLQGLEDTLSSVPADQRDRARAAALNPVALPPWWPPA